MIMRGAGIEGQVMEYDVLLDSSNMGPADWTKIAKDIHDNYDRYDHLQLHGQHSITAALI